MCLKNDVTNTDPDSEWPESQCSLARALYILDLPTDHSKSVNQTGCGKKAPGRYGPEGDTDLLRGVGAEHHGVLRADDHFVLDAHSHAVKVFGELRIGRDVDTFLSRRSRRQHGDDDTKHRRGATGKVHIPGSMVMTIPSFSLRHSKVIREGQREWINGY